MSGKNEVSHTKTRGSHIEKMSTFIWTKESKGVLLEWTTDMLGCMGNPDYLDWVRVSDHDDPKRRQR